MNIRENINAAIKSAMLVKDKATLQTLRMISAAFKQIEVDQRIEITDEIALRELVRQIKQRQDAAKQYHDAKRIDLAEQEELEISIIQRFMPVAFSEAEVRTKIENILSTSGLPRSMSSMKPLMAQLKDDLEGRADMAFVSQYLRSLLQP
ncbi:MAG: GatB/YqeY domain-containing protein [Cardiobacteriaceae bacterium]|nr:GatB/YqeY domain-containing protein [Cardiobacteriaceae bacterium]